MPAESLVTDTRRSIAEVFVMSGAFQRNFLVNTVAPIVRIVIALVTVPLYLHLIGDARYGVVSIVWSLVGYAGFLDFGLSRASANALAKIRDAPQAERAEVFVTTLILNVSIGCVAGGAMYFVADYLLRYVIMTPPILQSEISASLPWIATMLAATLAGGVGVGALESRERFTLANAAQIASVTVGQVLPIGIVIWVGPELAHVVAGIALGTAVGAIIAVALAAWQEGPIWPQQFRRERAASLFSYGGWVTVSSLMLPILNSFDQLLIGKILGVASVAHYAVAMNLALRSQFVPAALARTIFPRLSHSSSEEARDLASRAFISLAYGYAGASAFAIILAPVFFHYWIGANVAALSAPIAEILLIGAWVNGLAFVPYNLLQGQGRPDVTGKLHTAEVLPFLGVLWLLTKQFGVEGAAVAWTLRVAIDLLALIWSSGISWKTVASALPAFLSLIVSLAISRTLGDAGWQNFAVAAVAGAAVGAFGLYRSEDLRRAVSGPLNRLSRLSGLA